MTLSTDVLYKRRGRETDIAGDLFVVEKIQLNPQRLAPPSGPYSRGVKVRGSAMIFAAGQLGTDHTGRLVDATLEGQTRQALENLKIVLEEGGARLEDVVKLNIYLCDMTQYEAVWRVRAEYFTTNHPASTMVEVSSLGFNRDVKIEIEAIAVID